MYQQLIAAPSISAIEDHLCMSNKSVIELLAQWCESLGFNCEIIELERSNLVIIEIFGYNKHSRSPFF